MMNVYKNRVICFLFGITLITNIILVSLVFFAYSSIIKKDYEEKLVSVAAKTSANADRILSFFEEEIEVFINKYKVEEELESFKFDAPNFVRMDSTSFERISIFRGSEPVYASSAEIVDFYRQTEFDKKIIDITKSKASGWIINEDKESVLSPYERLVYVRTIYDTDTKERIGCVAAEVSYKQLTRFLNPVLSNSDSDKKEFVPHSLGICVDDKIFFLNGSGVPEITHNTENFAEKQNETYFVNSFGGKKFYTVYNKKRLNNKIHIVLLLFVVLFCVITFFSCTMLKFMVNEIYGRIGNLNRKMENYGGKSL